MQQHPHDGLHTGAPSVPTALVVDDSFASRARVITLLHLGGWRVHQAVGTEDALRLAALIEPDLVITEMAMRQGHGATLMRRLREQGSSARFVVVAARRTQQCRALASAAGALACLAKPVDPRLFVDVMRGLTPTVAPPSLRVASVREEPVAEPASSRVARRGDVPQRAPAPAVDDRDQRAGGRRRGGRPGRRGPRRGRRPARARRGRLPEQLHRPGRTPRHGLARATRGTGGTVRAAGPAAPG